MKQKIIILILAAMISNFGQLTAQRSINRLFDDLKKKDYSFALTIPGFLIDLGIKIAAKHTDSENKDALLTIKDKIKKFRIFVNEKNGSSHQDAIKHFVSSAAKKNLELYAAIKNEGSLVNVYVEQKKDKIKNVLLLINDQEQIVVIHLKTDITTSDFEKANFSFNKKKPSGV